VAECTLEQDQIKPTHSMKYLSIIAALCISVSAIAQKTEVAGIVKNKDGKGLGFATVTLLFPEDSTLAYFDITDEQGMFQVKDVKQGAYLLQAAFLGHQTFYKQLDLNNGEELLSLDPIILKDRSTELGTVEIEGEAIPFLIKKDTVEYNSGAFRTKTNASVEDLLKKLPGVEVDKDGAIKAQGESVQKVLVDGKEFFSNDPKLATKNIPADAIRKVQVYDKKSDASEFTGIDDGEREKTINLLLKADRKNGAFGEVTAGYGTEDRYVGSAKISRFSEKTQAMALGSINNVNDFGLSIGDLITFSGGPAVLRSGGGRITSSSAIPLSGQSQNGQLKSGLGGLTYSYEFGKKNTISANYLYSHTNRELKEESNFEQFTPTTSFRSISSNNSENIGNNHTANVYWTNEIDSLTKFILRGSIGQSDTKETSNGISTTSESDGTFSNENTSNSFDSGKSPNASVNGQLVRKLNGKIGRNVKVDLSGNFSESKSTSDWDNAFVFDTTQAAFENDQLWRIVDKSNSFTTRIRFNEPLGKGYYLEPDISYNQNNISYLRGDLNQKDANPEVSNLLKRNVNYTEAGLNFKKTSSTSSLRIGVMLHTGEQNVTLKGDTVDVDNTKNISRILPSLSYRKKFGKSNWAYGRINSSVDYPSSGNLFSVPNTQNQNFINVGNTDLAPEKSYTAMMGMILYDQFTFSSFNANVSATFTDDKITNEKFVNDRLVQISQTINYKDAATVRGSVSYNRPIKKYGIVIDVSASETFNRNYTLVNDEENILNSYTHSGDFSIGNKKKKKVDASVGIGFSLTDSKYSVQTDLNNQFLTTTYFGDIEWFITDSWTFGTALDYNIYDSQSFGDKQRVPLLTAELSHSFLQGDRGILKVSAFDLLNQYNGINRVAYQNSIGETRSNVVGQYFLLSFTYKLNKLAAESNKGGGMMFHGR
tara:strand:+ start:94744 stop:97548 length:2805 start_codon:yes stop_codon:yes gene_type:complete